MKELREKAKLMGLKGYSKMNKTQLTDYIGYVLNDVLEDYAKEEKEELPPIVVKSIKKI